MSLLESLAKIVEGIFIPAMDKVISSSMKKVVEINSGTVKLKKRKLNKLSWGIESD